MCINSKPLFELLKSASDRLDDSFSSREKKHMIRELLMSYSSLTSQQIMLDRDLVVDRQIVEKIYKSIDEINGGEPFQYALGKTFFFEHEFKVDARALIPRPETEELVHSIVELNKSHDLPKWNVLDVGTGTGCIALSLKLALPHISVTGIDISIDAIGLAKENAELLNADVTLSVKDVLSMNDNGDSYDLIVSNPPYIPEKEKSTMKSHVVDKEPELALFVENDNPLLFYTKIADLGLNMLKNSGYLAFEVHENLAEDVKNYLFLKGYKNISIRKDLQGKDRMVFAQFVNS